ncbi:redoxin domain-containing protein [Planctomicrobium piriforme]|uniref:AhpC/TSA family protein n=1 Tax=Planctomicrobium piriforme TaxID=1576369 RepID=A0A1I3FI72_9PLAN|nr:redoxin domain-containing protein [Planctomicrobium piriforme]SFI10886.1 AhpC/TSA family protein [Planctomicrobium piriforme]
MPFRFAPYLWLGIVLFSSQVADARGMRGEHEPEDVLVEAPLKRPSLGLDLPKLSFPISGFDADSQAFFGQGIAALHGFWIFEAERNFREVIRRNPDNPMGFAFAAYAQTVFTSGDYDRGKDYMNAARDMHRRGKVLTETEVNWLNAIHALYDNSLGDKYARQLAHVARLREALESATDPDIKRETNAFLTVSIWYYSLNQPKVEEQESKTLRQEADRRIDDVLCDLPTHPIHHYKIHLWNDGSNEILGRPSARLAGITNPACAHQWHMAAHIYNPLNELRSAAYQFEAAHRVDNKYVGSLGLPPQIIHNYAHNASFMMDVLSDCGAVDRSLAISRNIIAGPRAFDIPLAYNDPVDSVADGLITLLETHLLWDEAYQFQQQGYFNGLFTREKNVGSKAKLLRLHGLVMLERGETEAAQKCLKQLTDLRHAQSKQEKQAGRIPEIQRQEKDLSYWLLVRESSEPNSLPKKTIDELLEMDVTPKHRVALLAWESGDVARAEEIARNDVKDRPAHVMPRAVLTFLLANQNKGDEARKSWETLKPLVHVPLTGAARSGLASVRGATPFLKQIETEFLAKQLIKPSELDAFYGIPQDGRAPTLAAWEKQNRPMAELGPLELSLPEMPVGTQAAGLWDEPKQLTTRVQKMLEQGIGPDDRLLVMFRMNAECPKCNSEQAALIDKWGDTFKELGVQLLIVYPDGSDLKVPAHVSAIKDPSLKIFKAFGAYDEFTDQPVHAVYLVEPGETIRWSARTFHAFDKWEGFVEETQRQKTLKWKTPQL